MTIVRGTGGGPLSLAAVCPVLLYDGGASQFSYGLEVVSPELCPRQTRQQQEQGHHRDPHSDDCVEVSPEEA